MVRRIGIRILTVLNLIILSYLLYINIVGDKILYNQVSITKAEIPIECCTYKYLGQGTYTCTYNEYLAYKNYLISMDCSIVTKSEYDFLCTSENYSGRYIFDKSSNKLIKISPNMEETELFNNYT